MKSRKMKGILLLAHLRKRHRTASFGFLIFFFNVVIPILFLCETLIRSGFNDIRFCVWQCTALMQVSQRNQIDQTIDLIDEWPAIRFVQHQTFD